MKNNFIINGDTLIVYNRKDNREILFDAEDFDIISQSTWFIHITKSSEYATASSGKLRKKAAHRLLLGNPKNKQVDHENGNMLDNRKSNLRIATPKMNSHNNRKAKGYYWNKKANRWHAQIAINGKNKHIGMFKVESEARTAYLQAKKKYHPTAPIHLWEQ